MLALSGILVVAALSAFSGKGSFLFQNNVRQLAEDIRTVANETRSGLGPDNFETAPGTNTVADQPAQLSPPLATGETVFGEALELFPNCSGSSWCLVVHKLKLSADGSTISAYERYPIEVPANLQFNLADSTYDGVALNASSPNLTQTVSSPNDRHLVVVFKGQNPGNGTLFTRNSPASLDLSTNYFADSNLAVGVPAPDDEASNPANYSSSANQRTLVLRVDDINNDNVHGTITIDLASPTALKVDF